MSTSRSVGRGTGAFIYLPPFSENRPIFCSFPFAKIQPVFLLEQTGRKKHRTPFSTPAGITHYTLQAKSCAKGQAPLETPDNKTGGMLPERAAYRLFCCPGFPKGPVPWHTTWFTKCSVLYALSALPFQTGRVTGFKMAGKHVCDCVTWCLKHRAGFVSRRDVYENPHPPSHAGFRDKMSRLTDTLTKKQTGFLLKVEMGRKPF